MAEIEISINNSYVGIDKSVQPLLDEFERRQHTHVSLQIYDWGIAWAEFLKISLYRDGPVISQMGNSWMGSLIAQNSLRTFNHQEIAELGGQDRFLPGSWESCLDFDNRYIVAVPWIVDTYLVYYHRDRLAKAGIDEADAFSTPENFHATLQKLQDAGFRYPFAVPTVKSNSNIHTAASWVWGQGGDFINPDGTKVLLSKPETRKGLKMYFDLYRFISPQAKELTDRDCWDWFLDGTIAVTVRNPGLLFRLDTEEFPKSFAANIGAASMPGVPLLGGSHLVIWNHIQPEMEKDAVELVKFLTSPDIQLNLLENTGRIPANLQALERIPSTSFFAPFVNSMSKAKPFPCIRMWGLVEEKLVIGLSQIWKALLTSSNPDVDQVIAGQLDPIEHRLNLALSQ